MPRPSMARSSICGIYYSMRYINSSLKVPLLDAIDRFTIIELKSERLRDEKDRGAVQNEYDFFKKTLDAYRTEGVTIKDEWLRKMRDINAKIWDVESDIRNGRRNNLNNEAVGHLAVKLRDLNDVRGKERAAMVEEIQDDFYELPPALVPGADTSLKLPLHEAIDRLTIAELKVQRLAKDKNLPSFERERAFYARVLDSYRADDGVDIKDGWLESMRDMNGRVWDEESAIRQGREKEFGLEAMGSRTLMLRDMSKERVGRKNKIAAEAGSNFYEVKTEVI